MSAAQASLPLKIESILEIRISLTRSEKKEALIGYRISMTMFSSSISEAGKNIGDSNARTRAVLTVRSTVLLFGREFYEEAYSAKRMELKDYPGRNCAYTSKCV